MKNTPDKPKSHPPVPTARMTAVLAAAMLGIGVAVGAAIGPAPSPSFALGRLLPLLPSFLAARSAAHSQPPASTPEATPATATGRRKRHRKATAGATSTAAETSATATTTTAQETSTTKSKTEKSEASKLPPVTKVWLIELADSSFSEVAAQATAAPYLDTQATPLGTLLSGWSALDGSLFANDAALIAGSSPQVLDTIVQPPCPEGTTTCAEGTPGAVTAADEFLKATLPTITSTPAYKENGLVVVTFASVATATGAGLPAGAATATLTSQPPSGVLLISPFVTAGAKSSATFSPTSPKQSLEKLLRR